MKKLPVGMVFLLKRTELTVRACVEQQLVEFDITPVQFMVLNLLHHHEGTSAAQIARSIGVRPQSVNEIIGPLVRKGLICRRESPTHGRILETRLSASGRRLLKEALSAARDLETVLFASFGERTREQFRRNLERLRERAKQYQADAGARRVAAKSVRVVRRRQRVAPADVRP